MNRIELEADVYFLREDEGGRRSPPSLGYCPSFCVSRVQLSCVIEALDNVNRCQIPLGAYSRVRLAVVNPEMLEQKLATGVRFSLKEASRVVARGVIRNILELDKGTGPYY